MKITNEDESLLEEYRKELSREGLGLGWGIRRLINEHRSMHQHVKQMSQKCAADIARAYSNGYNAALGTRVVSIEQLKQMTLQDIVDMLDNS
jgi:hypothetical protein